MKTLIITLMAWTSVWANIDMEKVRYVHRFFSRTRFRKVALAITAMGAEESAWFTNRAHVEANNYFSIKDFKRCCKGTKCLPINCLAVNNSLEESCEQLRQYLIRKRYSTDNIENFLKDLKSKGYAENPVYTDNIRKVMRSVKKRLK